MKDLGFLVDSELSASQQCTLVAVRPTTCWAAFVIAQDKDRDYSSSALVRLHLFPVRLPGIITPEEC